MAAAPGLAGLPIQAHAAGFEITGRYSFPASAANPVNPSGAPVEDAAGNLYGVSFDGGNAKCKCGSVFELSPPATAGSKAWTRKTLHVFLKDSAGYNPGGALALDASGNLFGTTEHGTGSGGAGVAFELSPPAVAGGPWTYKVIHYFGSPFDIGLPHSLTADTAGNLYGATDGNPFTFAGGIVFRLSPPTTGGGKWAFSTLYTFTGGADGGAFVGPLRLLDPANPKAGVYGATAGNTYQGGSVASTIFHLTPPAKGSVPWVKTIDATLSATSGPIAPLDGVYPVNAAGALYLVGASQNGGDPTCQCGAVFSFNAATKTMNVLVAFTGKASQNGAAHIAAPFALKSGGYAIYGISQLGGAAGHGQIWHIVATPTFAGSSGQCSMSGLAGAQGVGCDLDIFTGGVVVPDLDCPENQNYSYCYNLTGLTLSEFAESVKVKATSGGSESPPKSGGLLEGETPLPVK
jgi:hypothetical protein